MVLIKKGKKGVKLNSKGRYALTDQVVGLSMWKAILLIT